MYDSTEVVASLTESQVELAERYAAALERINELTSTDASTTGCETGLELSEAQVELAERYVRALERIEEAS